ncbi:MAG TPA: glycogen debranching protein GlgX [Vicinamibacterales bacterium]|nr:glycogen debranching protein GlgX [Vicinamibacterales bacterium]
MNRIISTLGSTWDGSGVQFAIFSAHATSVDLCLFGDADEAGESRRVPLVRDGRRWHTYVPGLGPGQRYGYRVDGPWAPAAGHWFNPAKVLFDPYARAVGRPFRWDPSLWTAHDPDVEAPTPDARDSAPFAPLAAVVDPAFDWGNDRPPRTPWPDTVIYELHVKGFTALHDAIPAPLRGTYLGLASEPAIRHLVDLGVTAVELLPVHLHAGEWPLVRRGLENYWGYNTLGYFAPDHRFATGGDPARAVDEFRAMVRALHAAGLEVILDVVYNHTAEGHHLGPTLSFRGIDNASYYRPEPTYPWRYLDVTGTGNTVNVDTPEVGDLILDSLRYWVSEMHVDGFRFDLATTLARGPDGVTRPAPLFEAIERDPVLAGVKHIAEPWDVGPDGYQLGAFPAGWAEWNNRYRDTVRRFWRGDAGQLPDLATRLSGSSDLFPPADRSPHASINYVTSHDGFTLADLVSYAAKHNAANGEDNRDGEHENFSWNHGVEGATSNDAILAQRARDRRNLLLTLLVSLGTPMISAGDEVGRTQQGNNNAYCQDSDLTWTPWGPAADARLHAFTRQMLALRAGTPALRRTTFFGPTDVRWLRPEGGEMTEADWHDAGRRALGMLIDGTVLVLLNAADRDVTFVLPETAGTWELRLNTADPTATPGRPVAGVSVLLASRSSAILGYTGEYLP